MSLTSSLLKSFFNPKVGFNPQQLTSQELYSIYLLVKKTYSKLEFLNVSTLQAVLCNTKSTSLSGSVPLTLYTLFNSKTFTVLRLVDVTHTQTYQPNTYTTLDRFVLPKVLSFWRKFKKLKRPSTEKNFNEYFLVSWENKINLYKNLGFLKTHDTFYIVKTSCTAVYDTVINVNKPLLSSPKFSSTSLNKFLNVEQLNVFEFQFLRKNKVYNKGRYSRCRQNYRTGVYMCMYLSVCSIFGLYYWFYKFTFNFTYLWWFFIAFFGSFFLPKIVKYRFYEPTTLINKFFDFFRWLSALIKSFF